MDGLVGNRQPLPTSSLAPLATPLRRLDETKSIGMVTTGYINDNHKSLKHDQDKPESLGAQVQQSA